MASFKGFVEGLTGVASEVGSHLLDPSGKKRGTVAYEELINSMQPALAKEVLDYERNTRFWVEHDAMLKRTNKSSTDWKEAKLRDELMSLKEFYKDTDYKALQKLVKYNFITKDLFEQYHHYNMPKHKK